MSLKKLTEIKFPDLINFDRTSFVNEIIERMQLDEEWNKIYDGQLHHNATQAILEFFAYMFEKNARSQNKNIKENFLNQSFSDQSIYDNVKQMKIDIKQNTEATVEIIGILDGTFLTEPLVIPKFYKLPATNLNGESINFEVIKKENGEYDYLDNVIINPGNFARDNFVLSVYSGTTFNNEYIISDESLEQFKLTVNYDNIIDNSIKVYYKHSNGTMVPLIVTKSFLISPYITPQSSSYFPNGVPHYVVNYLKDGTVEILFGSASFGSAFDQSHINNSIVVYGRQGGGLADNIPQNSIQHNDSFILSANKQLDISFINVNPAYGGSNAETAEELKTYAPYRYGREDKNIVDKIDAKIALQQKVVKHELTAPLYSEIDDSINLLHVHHKIVPNRNFSDFIFPEVINGDTLDTYLVRFLLELNSFCNVKGTHDGEVSNEYVSQFFKSFDTNSNPIYNFQYQLNKNNPLSGTLKATAYNYNNDIIDHIIWNGNYYNTDVILSAQSTDNAKMTTSVFSVINIETGKNNYIKFKIDNVNYEFVIELPTGTKSVAEIAASIQNSIINIIETETEPNVAFYQYRTFNFISYVITNEATNSGTISFNSPTVGKNSKITLLDNGLNNVGATDLYEIWGLEVNKIYRPLLETEKVFAKENIFYHLNNEINFLFDNTAMDKSETHDYKVEWNQNNAVEDGTIIDFVLVDSDDPAILEKLQIDENIIIKAFDDGDNLLDYVDFNNIKNAEDNAATFNGSGDVFDQNSSDTNFDYTTSNLKLQLKPGIKKDLYEQSFPVVTEIMIRKVVWNAGQGDYVVDDIGTDWETTKWTEPIEGWTQDILSSTGPDVNVDVGSLITSGFETGENYEVRIYKTISGSPILMSKVRYLNVDVSGAQFGEDNVIVESDIVLQAGEVHYYDPSTKTLTLKGADPTVDVTSPDYYAQGFVDFEYITIDYKRKSYEYITVDYNPNPYAAEGEAKEYLDVLYDKEKRLLGLEHLIKTIDFIPFGTEIVLYIYKNYSLNDAIDIAKETMQEYFGYNNSNYEHTIGVAVNNDLLANAINRELLENGIAEIKVLSNNPITTLPSVIVKDSYFFLFDQSTIDKIAAFESNYTELTGLSDIFKINITAVRKDI